VASRPFAWLAWVPVNPSEVTARWQSISGERCGFWSRERLPGLHSLRGSTLRRAAHPHRRLRSAPWPRPQPITLHTAIRSKAAASAPDSSLQHQRLPVSRLHRRDTLRTSRRRWAGAGRQLGARRRVTLGAGGVTPAGTPQARWAERCRSYPAFPKTNEGGHSWRSTRTSTPFSAGSEASFKNTPAIMIVAADEPEHYRLNVPRSEWQSRDPLLLRSRVENRPTLRQAIS